MQHSTKKVIYSFLALMLVGFVSSSFAAALQVQSFKKSAWNQAEQKQHCTQLAALCQQPEQWHSVTTADGRLWVLSGGDIAQFSVSATGFKLLQQWHIELAKPEHDDGSNTPFIFPKLFPMTQNRYAVAVIDRYSEMYSGGGAGVERASFYELKHSGKMQPFIQNYPFSLNRMIRACFSEQDYAISKGHCHDEDALSLDIRPIKPMLWQFRYRYRLTVSLASDSGEKSFKGSRNINIDLNHAPSQPNIPVQWNYAGIE